MNTQHRLQRMKELADAEGGGERLGIAAGHAHSKKRIRGDGFTRGGPGLRIKIYTKCKIF